MLEKRSQIIRVNTSRNVLCEFIKLSEKFLSFHKMIIDEQQFLFYIILLN